MTIGIFTCFRKIQQNRKFGTYLILRGAYIRGGLYLEGSLCQRVKGLIFGGLIFGGLIFRRLIFGKSYYDSYSECISECISCKKVGKSLEPFWRKGHKSRKNIFFGHLIPYNAGLRIFLENPYGSNNVPYCLLHSCKILGKSLELFWKKGQKSKENNTFFGHLISYNTGLINFSEKPSSLNNGHYCLLHSCKNLRKFLEPFWRRGQRRKKHLFLTRTLRYLIDGGCHKRGGSEIFLKFNKQGS